MGSLPPGARPAYADNNASDDDERPISFYSTGQHPSQPQLRNNNSSTSTSLHRLTVPDSPSSSYHSPTTPASPQKIHPYDAQNRNSYASNYSNNNNYNYPNNNNGNKNPYRNSTLTAFDYPDNRASYYSNVDLKKSREVDIYHSSRTPTHRAEPSQSQDTVERPKIGADWGADEDRAPPENEKSKRRKEKWQGRGGKARYFLYHRIDGNDADDDDEPHKRPTCCGWLSNAYLCGVKALYFLIGFGIFIAALVVVLAICIPRPPSFSYNIDSPLEENTDTSTVDPLFTRAPSVNFTFDANMNLAAQTTNSFVPLRFSSFTAKIRDQATGKQVGTEASNVPKFVIPAKETAYPFHLPLTFSYSAPEGIDVATDDDVWNRWYNSCMHKWPGHTDRPGLNFTIEISWSVIGIVSSDSKTVTINNSPCPIELPSDQ